MSLRIIECEQNTDAWLAARRGIPTASEFDTVQAGGKGLTRRAYMLTLLGERMTGEVQPGYSNAHMERGHALEPEARELYAFQHDAIPERVGFAVRDDLRAGASPDSFLGENGVLEIKTKLPKLQLDVLLRDQVPAEHAAQVQGLLLVTCREFVDFVSYWPKLPLFVKRVYRDEPYIAKLTVALREFNAELDELEARIRAMA